MCQEGLRRTGVAPSAAELTKQARYQVPRGRNECLKVKFCQALKMVTKRDRR